jgi:DNA-binding transcriptional LysR family regulator
MRHATLRQLRAFAVVARHRSFARAASDLRLSPSAVSLQIKELEGVLRLSLFERTAKTVSLTHGGERLLAEVEKILAALDRASQVLDELHGEPTGRVAVGMVGNAQHFVPRLLARFHESRHDVVLSLQVGNRERLLDQLQRGEVDLAIMGTPPDGFTGRADPFSSQPLGIVAPRDHALAGRRAIPASELVNQKFIVREAGSGTRSAMERFFHSAQIEPPRAMEMGNNESIKQAVMANMGLAFLSLHTAALELRSQLLVALDVVGLPLLRPWYVVSGSLAEPCEKVSSLRRFILEAGPDAVTPALDPAPHGPWRDAASPAVWQLTGS